MRYSYRPVLDMLEARATPAPLKLSPAGVFTSTPSTATLTTRAVALVATRRRSDGRGWDRGVGGCISGWALRGDRPAWDPNVGRPRAGSGMIMHHR